MKTTFLTVLIMLLILSPCAAQGETVTPGELASFSVQVPYGAKDRGLAVQGSNLSAYVFVESYQHGDMDVAIHLDFPDGFVVYGDTLQPFTLRTEYDDWYQFIDFYVPPDTPCGVYTIIATASIGFGEQHELIEREISLRVASRDEVSGMISLSGVVIPSDKDGVGDPSRPADTIVLQETSPALKRLTGMAGLSDSDDIKVSYVGIEVGNSGDEAVPLMVLYEILDSRTGLPVGEFRPSVLGMSSETFSYASIILPAKSKELVGIPIYTSDRAMGGEYLLRVSTKITGSDWTADTKDVKITAISRNWNAIIISLIAFLVTISGIVLFVSRSNRIMNSFKTRHLVMIALFGTASFASVNIPMTFLWDLSHAILGPFSFLFTGIFYEVVLYMLIVAAVVLMPKPGVVTLLLMVRYILNGIVLGHFNPIFLMSYSVNAIVMEVLLYGAGITRKGDVERMKTGLICGIGDSLSQYVSFNLWMVLYRLFYSGWYIKANIFIDGFIYTFIGAWLGVNLGNRLRKVVE